MPAVYANSATVGMIPPPAPPRFRGFAFDVHAALLPSSILGFRFQVWAICPCHCGGPGARRRPSAIQSAILPDPICPCDSVPPQRRAHFAHRVDFNATTHGQRDLADDRLSHLIERISQKRLGLGDVEPDIIGRSYEYLIRKFAEGSVSSAGEFYTPGEVGMVMARIMDPEPGMEVYDPSCGSAGLLIKCQLVLEEKMSVRSKAKYAPLKLYGQEYVPETWAMANMNMIIHDMEGQIEIGDTFRNPKFHRNNRLQTFDRVVANPMWNQDWFVEKDYDNDELDRFPKGAGFPGRKADWGWVQIILASLTEKGRAAVVLDTGAASRGSGNANTNKEKEVRKWFVDQDLIEGVFYLPENLFYNTTAAGIILVLNKAKPKERQNKLLLVNASAEFAKGDPKNYIPEENIARIADTFLKWREEDKFSQIVGVKEIAKNDYNISPSRYIHTAAGAEYRPIPEIVEELEETRWRNVWMRPACAASNRGSCAATVSFTSATRKFGSH